MPLAVLREACSGIRAWVLLARGGGVPFGCIANPHYFFILRHMRQFATLVELETIALADLIPYALNALNARTHTESQVNQIAASISEFGWTVPIPVAGTP